MKLTSQKALALDLLQWHGGQSSGLYAVGSCMLADASRGIAYYPANNRGHTEDAERDDCGALNRAIDELRRIARRKVKFPDTLTLADIAECSRLINRLLSLQPPKDATA